MTGNTPGSRLRRRVAAALASAATVGLLAAWAMGSGSAERIRAG